MDRGDKEHIGAEVTPLALDLDQLLDPAAANAVNATSMAEVATILRFAVHNGRIRATRVHHLCRLYHQVGMSKWATALLYTAADLGLTDLAQWACSLPDDSCCVTPAFNDNFALRVAAANGHAGIVRLLCQLPVARGVDPAACDSEALRHAAARGHADIVRLLCQLPVERGVDPAACDNHAVRVAAGYGHVATVRVLCQLPVERGVDPAARDSDAVCVAAANGHVAALRYLCELPAERGIDPSATTRALRGAATYDHVGTLRYLYSLPQVQRRVTRQGTRDVLSAAWRGMAFFRGIWAPSLDALEFLVRHHARGDHANPRDVRNAVDRHARRVMAGHLQHLLFADPMMCLRGGRGHMRKRRLACAHLLRVGVMSNGFRGLTESLPLFTRLLVAAAVATSEPAACTALRTACMVADVANAQGGCGGGRWADTQPRVARRRAEALMNLLREVEVAAFGMVRRFTTCAPHIPRRFWRLVGDVVQLLVPSAPCLTARDRARFVATVPRSMRASAPGWCPGRGRIVSWLRRFHRVWTLLYLRLLCDAGRASPVVRANHAHART